MLSNKGDLGAECFCSVALEAGTIGARREDFIALSAKAKASSVEDGYDDASTVDDFVGVSAAASAAGRTKAI